MEEPTASTIIQLYFVIKQSSKGNELASPYPFNTIGDARKHIAEIPNLGNFRYFICRIEQSFVVRYSDPVFLEDALITYEAFKEEMAKKYEMPKQRS